MADKSPEWLAAEAGFGVAFSDFRRLATGNSSRNFQATACADGRRYLVKFGRESAVRILTRIAGAVHDPLFVPMAFGAKVFQVGDEWCCAMDWLDGVLSVRPQDMTSIQIRELVAAYGRMSDALQVLSNGCKPDERLIHGDLHFDNVLFRGDRVVAFVDFEMMRSGYPTDDLLRVFVHRMERTRFWKFGAMSRLFRGLGEMIRCAPYSADDWLAAIERYVVRKNAIRARKSRWRWVAAVEWYLRAPLYARLRKYVNQTAAGISSICGTIGKTNV